MYFLAFAAVAVGLVIYSGYVLSNFLGVPFYTFAFMTALNSFPGGNSNSGILFRWFRHSSNLTDLVMKANLE